MGLTKIRQSGGGTHSMYHRMTDRNMINAEWLLIYKGHSAKQLSVLNQFYIPSSISLSLQSAKSRTKSVCARLFGNENLVLDFGACCFWLGTKSLTF